MSADEIPNGYALPVSVEVRLGEVQEQQVIVMDMTVVAVNDGVASEEQRAVLVLTPEDAKTVAFLLNNINTATAGEES